MTRRHLAVGAVAVVVALGVAAGWRYMDAQAKVDPSFRTVTVQRGDMEKTVAALGMLEPLQYVDVGTQVSGQIEKILVDAGDQVKEGDLLAVIDPTVYRTRVEADRATLKSLDAQLAEQKALLTLAEQKLARQKGLYEARATSREALDSAAAEAEIARARIEGLLAEISKAQSTLAADEANLGYTQIVAPMDGTVMSLSARQGQTLNANQSAPIILQIADLETMTVRTQVSEADVGKLTIGMEAYFTTLGDPERRWTGRLRQILPTPEVINDVVLYNALFEVDNADRRLLPKMTAQVFFVLGRAEDAVLVPMSALEPGAEPGSYTVRVLAGDAVEPRTVIAGLQDRVNAAIVSGLQPGDRVIAGAASAPVRSGPGAGPPR